MAWLRPLLLVLALLAVAGTSGASARPLDDLMMDLNLTPLEPKLPPPLNVTTINGARVSLSEIREQPVLVYFWATW
jgi:cytochrome oxidase Cu insertion factor (SCO1/SenC/PrrC family)